MKKKEKKVINDLLYFNNLKIVQNKDYFNFSLDSVLLANFVKIIGNNKRIIDLCTGNAPIPLILSTKTNSTIYGVEIQKEIYDLAYESISINNKKNIRLINSDVKKISKLFETDYFDIVTCNPPYFRNTEDSIKNDNKIKSIARHELLIGLEDIINISKKILKNGGSLYLVHRTDRLMDVLTIMRNNNIEPKKIRFIYPKIDKESNLFLVEGQKNGKCGLKLLSPLFVHNDDGSYTKEIIKIFGKE